MGLVVQKYGGTSVGSIERIKAVADRVVRVRDAGDRVVVVVSAMAGETNRLFKLASELSETPSARETEQPIGLTGHRGHDHDDSIAAVAHSDDAIGDRLDPLD